MVRNDKFEKKDVSTLLNHQPFNIIVIRKMEVEVYSPRFSLYAQPLFLIIIQTKIQPQFKPITDDNSATLYHHICDL